MLQSNVINSLRKLPLYSSQIRGRKNNKEVKNLCCRIFLARKPGNWRKLQSLQKLMQINYANPLEKAVSPRFTLSKENILLEPEWKAVFEPKFNRFRCVRSCKEAIEKNIVGLKCANNNWVLEADIKRFFDKIADKSILKNMD